MDKNTRNAEGDIIKLGGVAWIAPLVESVTLPAHAQTSPVPTPRKIDTCEDAPILSFDGFLLSNTGGDVDGYIDFKIRTAPDRSPPRWIVYQEDIIDGLKSGESYDFTKRIPGLGATYWEITINATCVPEFKISGTPDDY